MSKSTYPIFFIAADPLWALGLLTVYENSYVITTGNVEPLLALGITSDRVKIIEDSDLVFKSPRKLLLHPAVQQYVIDNSKKEAGIMLFRGYFSVIEALDGSRLSHERNVIDLNSNHHLVLGFEHKNNSYMQMKGHRVVVPHSTVTTMNQTSYEDCVKKFDLPFVIQLPRGWAGHNTYIIENEHHYKEFESKHKDAPLKISAFYEGVTLTVNTVISETKTHVSYPFLQLNDDAGVLSSSTMSSVGNRWGSLQDMCFCDDSIEEKIKTEVEKVAAFMKRHDYRGFAGIDVILSDNSIYVQEINPRLTASVPYISKLEKETFGSSLMEQHILAVTDSPLDDIDYWRPMNATRIVGRKLDEKYKSSIQSGIFDTQMIKQNELLDDFYTSPKDLMVAVASRGISDLKINDELFQLFSINISYNKLYEEAKSIQKAN